MLYKNLLFSLLFILFSTISFYSKGQLMINEFMAINNSTLQDEDEDFSDWIEIKNNQTIDIKLKGWSLTDEKESPSKWIFPELTLAPNSYIIVFASGKNKTNATEELHTNFKLSGSGEYLALYMPGGNEAASEFAPNYPIQYADVSYGTHNNENTYFANTTAGFENIESLFIAPPVFSKKHGYYYESFNLELIKSSNEIEIFYTTDSSTPSPTNGIVYSKPINISTTTIIRAVSYIETNGLSTTLTASYIFPNDIKNQSNNQPGYPSTWLQPIRGTDDYDRISANYDMKAQSLALPDVSNNLVASLESLPVISIVTDVDNLFSEEKDSLTGGIYTYNGEPNGPTRNLVYHLGRGWERAASVEYFDSNKENGSLDFQANCAIKIHGGACRTRSKTEKHSLKIGFKSEYGVSKLDDKVFGKGSPKQYDWLILRGGYAPRLGLQVMDPWAKQTMRDMGQYAAYNKFVHVYLNGLYWGMYNLSERMDENCMRDNLGGSSNDYDIIKDYYEVESGDTKAWDKLVNFAQDDIEEAENYQYIIGKEENGTPNSSYSQLLNDENFLDYVIFNIFAATSDWDHHNWVAVRRKTNTEGFHFLVWDAEKIFSGATVQSIIDNANENRPTGIFADLIKSKIFKDKIISHINKHFFENGALIPANCLERYEKILGAIDTALIADQTRWVIDKNDIWNNSYHEFIYDYFPNRTEDSFRQFIVAGLYPSIDFPRYNTSKTRIADTLDIFLSTPSSGEIIYTLDGSDPGHLKPDSESIIRYDYQPVPLVEGENIINARVKQDSLWSRLITKKYTVYKTDYNSGFNNKISKYQLINSPNPIENQSTLTFHLNNQANINIRILNIFGSEVKSIVNEPMDAGYHSIQWHSEELLPGIYFCILENRMTFSIETIKLIKKQ